MSDSVGDRSTVRGKASSPLEQVNIAMVQQDLGEAHQEDEVEMSPKKLGKLLKKCKHTDNPQVLKDAAAAVKAALAQKKDTPKVMGLLICDECSNFLKNCLKAKYDGSSLHADAVWIIGWILKEKGISYGGCAGTVPLLIKLLGTSTSDMALLEQLTETIGLIDDQPRLRHELVATSNSSLLLKTLTRLLKTEDPSPSEQLIRNVDTIIENLVSLRATITTDTKFEKVRRPDTSKLNWYEGEMTIREMSNEMPATSLLENSLPVISLLMDTKIDQVRDDQLQYICYALVRISAITPFVENGIIRKLPMYLEKPNTAVGVAIFLGTVAYDHFIPQLLAELQKAESLKLHNYWRCMYVDTEDPCGKNSSNAVLSFMDGIRGMIYKVLHCQNCADVVDTIFETGYIQALGLALQNDVAVKCRDIANHTLALLSCIVSDERKEAIMKMGIVPHAGKLLKDENPDEVYCAASLIGMLVNGRADRRETTIELGVLPILLRTIREDVVDSRTMDSTHRAFKALKCILQVEPKAPLVTFKNVVEVVTEFLGVKRKEADHTIILGLNCLMKLVEYGGEGIDFILEVDRFVPVVTKFLYCKKPKLQLKAAELLLQISQKGSAEQRGILLDSGVLEHFKDVLLSSSRGAKKAALQCLLIFLDEELNAFQELLIERLKSAVMAEIVKGHPETVEVARSVYKKMTN